MQDDDCEDQGMATTDVCTLFKCQEWHGNVRHRPRLVLRGKYWCCPSCGASYGEHPMSKEQANARETVRR